MTYGLIIFDMDGTLVDSLGGIAKGVNVMLEEKGYPTHPVRAYKDFVGNGLYQTVVKALPLDTKAQQVDLCYQRMLATYQVHYNHKMSLYKGVEDLLDQVEDKAIMAINSNKNHDMVLQIAKDYLSSWSFQGIYGTNDIYPRKPDPTVAKQIIHQASIDKGQVLYVGDTEVDVLTAQAAGIDSAFVTWGFRNLDQVKDLGPTYVCQTVEDLLKIII